MNDMVKRELFIAKEKVEKLKKQDSLIFVSFTDLHAPSDEHVSVDTLCEVLDAVSNEIPLDAVINLGDNFFARLGRKTHITNPELKILAAKLFNKISSSSKAPMIFVNGNHDGLGTDFFKPEFWNELTKGKYGHKAATYGDEGSYFYIDYEKKNTRLVFLSFPPDADIESERISHMWEFGKSQLDWLKEKALKTEKYVILMVHTPFCYKYLGSTDGTLSMWDGERERQILIKDFCGDVYDLDKVVAILDDFKKNNPQKLVAAFSGHMHYDMVWEPNEEKIGLKNSLPCVQIVSNGFYNESKEADKADFSLDIVVWTPSQKKLDTVRVGEGEDLSFSF